MTNFGFNRDVPNAPNNPSVDQPEMKINNQSTQDLIAVDHITFGANDGGQHKAIHFNVPPTVGYVPTVFPVNPPQLFITFVDSPPRLKYYAGTAAQSSTQYNVPSLPFGPPGGGDSSAFLLGGLILKTGVFTDTGAQTQVVSYVTDFSLAAFPNGTLAVSLTPTNALAVDVLTNRFLRYVDTYTASGFTLRYVSNPGGGPGATYNVIAIGF